MIKIGNLNISSFKLGGADCSIYLGNVKLYPAESLDAYKSATNWKNYASRIQAIPT